MKPEVNIFWFRRDLRLDDNAGLFYALKAGKPVVPVFIFDREILDKLEDKADRRVEFIHAAVTEMQQKLTSLHTSLQVFYDFPVSVFSELSDRYQIDSVLT